MNEELWLALLGNVEVRQAGAPVTFSSGKALALLCYLAVTGRPHLRPRLTGLLWGDLAEEDARNNLRKALSQLRQLVGPHLDITRQTVAFNRDSPYWLDVEVFEASVAEATTAADMPRLHEAVALYRGDFLEGFYLRQAPSFEEWSLTQQARLRELALQALHRLTAYYTGLGEAGYPAGIEAASRLLALEPWREEAHRQLMLLLARSGRRSAALAQYETCRQLLAEELGVEPGAETTRLYEQIRQADFSTGSSAVVTAAPQSSSANGEVPRHNLPAQLMPFIGRAADLQRLGELLSRPEHRLITLVGPGGCGKTRLALALAEHQMAAYRDGVFFVSLAPIANTALIAPAIAAAVGLLLQGSAEPQVQLLNFLRAKELLLVVDNVEHLLPDVTFLTHLLQQAPQATLLATSREPLHLYGESTYRLTGLQVPTAPHDNNIESFDAIRLFVQRAQHTDATFRPNQADLAQSTRICRLVEGLPLGIELAASWIRQLSCAEIRAELERDLGLLTTSYADVPNRHRSLNAVIQHSWQLLTSAEQEVLRSLTVFRGGFERAAAEQVARANLIVLSSLVDKSLLQRDLAGRYSLHEMVQQFAREQLRLSDQEEQVRDKHLAYYLALVEASERDILGPAQFDWLQQLDLELDNIRAALAWCQESSANVGEGLRLAGMLGWYWFLSNQWREGRQWAEQLLQRCPPGDLSEDRAKALIAAAGMAIAMDSYEDAEKYLVEGITILHRVGNQFFLARAFNFLGMGALYQGQLERAYTLHEESLTLYRKFDVPGEYLWTLDFLGQTILAMGDYQRAYTVLQECLELNQKIGYTISLAPTLIDLARVERCLNDMDGAEAHLHECLAIAEQFNILRFKSHALCNLGWIALKRAGTTEARQRFVESLRLYRQLLDSLGLAEALEGLASVSVSLAEWEPAALLLGAAEALRERIGAPVPTENRIICGETVGILQQHLEATRLTASWTSGRNTDLEKVMDDLLA